MLDQMVVRFKPCPFNDQDGKRIGTVLRIWREDGNVLADIECVEADLPADSAFYRGTGG